MRPTRPRAAAPTRDDPAGEVASLRRELADAIAQQAATARVLKTLSRSPADLQAVLDSLVENAARLSRADVGWMTSRFPDGQRLRAQFGHTAAEQEEVSRILRDFRVRPKGFMNRIYAEAGSIHLEDITADPDTYAASVAVQIMRGRTVLGVPVRSGDSVLAAFVLVRREVRPFSQREIDLVQTFADQAAIAIENARLFNETKEALERQTATGEVLRAIAGSPTDEQPVLDAIARNAVRFCGAEDAAVLLIEGDSYRAVAHEGPLLADVDKRWPVDRTSAGGRTMVDRTVIHVPDIELVPDEFPTSHDFARRSGQRAMAGAPLLREGAAIGAILLRRRTPGLFSDRQLELLRTFADQAVIAIENVRLFNETKEALAHQRAIAEILEVVSRSPSDVQPVLDAIVRSAATLTDADSCAVFRAEGDHLVTVAARQTRLVQPGVEIPLHKYTVPTVVFREGRTVHVEDAAQDTSLPQGGPLTRLGVPIVTASGPYGAIIVGRLNVRPFSDRQIQLIETFARQAGIAIENVRLFNETKEALAQQTATSEVLQSISRSAFDLDAVLRTVLDRARELCQADHAMVVRRRAEGLRLVSYSGSSAVLDDQIKRQIADGRPYVLGPGDETALTERRSVQLTEAELSEELERFPRGFTSRTGSRARLSVPLLRGDEALGLVVLGRLDPRGFSPREVALIETFADQAVIAIENVRLFNETKGALDRQTAVSEILRAISGSPGDVQPVLDAIAENTVRYCAVEDAFVYLISGDRFVAQAHAGPIAISDPAAIRVDPGWVMGRAILEKRQVQVPDLLAPEAAREFPHGHRFAVEHGLRAALATPLVRDGQVVGVIGLRRREPLPFTPEELGLVATFAEQALIAIENVRLFNETKEALERQTATSDVLRAISDSAFDLQPMFDRMLAEAARLCRAEFGVLYQAGIPGLPIWVGRPVAYLNVPPTVIESNQRVIEGVRAHLVPGQDPGPDVPKPLGMRVYLQRATVHVPEVVDDPEMSKSATYRELGVRAVLGVPMRHKGDYAGAITLWKTAPGPFDPAAIRLVESFADQAAIAIENVRLFNETKAGLERQTAIAEILRVISSSPTDVQPVLNTIAESAARYCEADDAGVVVIGEDGNTTLTATHGRTPQPVRAFSVEARSVTALSIRQARLYNVADMEALSDEEFADGKRYAREFGYRAFLSTPLLKDGRALGAIQLRRNLPGVFSPEQVELVQTFAAQAVIALENVRLFNETTEALGQQTAVSDVLQVISRSAFDLQPVLDAATGNAMRLSEADVAWMVLVEGDRFRQVAIAGSAEDKAALEQRQREVPQGFEFTEGSIASIALTRGEPFEISDLEAEPAIAAQSGMARLTGSRSVLAVPMLREGRAIGALIVARKTVRGFTLRQIQLVRTFADQAAIAIENVRLFNETKEGLERQTAIAAILNAISASPTDVQPVLDAIALNARRFCAAEDASVLLVRDGVVRVGAHDGPVPATDGWPVDRTTVSGRAIVERRLVHVADLQNDDDFPLGKQQARELGERTVLATPLLREGEAIGAIIIRRFQAQPFTERQAELVRTFADQAVIAIENVRLFNETKEALEQQTATSDVLQVISRSAFDLQRVLDTLVENATRLTDSRNGFVFRLDGETYRLAASHGAKREFREFIEAHPIDPTRNTLVGRTALERAPVHIPDVLKDPEYTWTDSQRLGGFRTMLGVPMLREGAPIGVIAVWRDEVRPFSDRQIQLLQTFADQAVIAIENVRLFNETKQALDQQRVLFAEKDAVADVLAAISTATTDPQPVFDVILKRAVELCGADHAVLRRLEGTDGVVIASYGFDPNVPVLGSRQAVAQITPGRRIVAGEDVVHIMDMSLEPATGRPGVDGPTRRAFPTRLGVAVRIEGRLYGWFNLVRSSVRPFSDREIQLVRTFADQAAIAIENVRLFNETKESLEQQTAVAEILKTISRSAFDLRPVLETLVEQAARLCDAEHGSVHRWDGSAYRTAAFWGPALTDEYKRTAFTQPRYPGRDTLIGRTALTRDVVHITDVLEDPEYAPRDLQSLSGYRTVLGVPLLREGFPIGVFGLMRNQVKPFTDRQIELVRTFADQAAIAMENVRLFNETKESLERQTATSEVLRVMAQSPADVQPVLDSIAENAARVCGASDAHIYRVDGDALRQWAHFGPIPGLRPDEVVPLDRRSIAATTVLDRRTIHIRDAANRDDMAAFPVSAEFQKRWGHRTLLAVPLARQDVRIGAIVIRRMEVQPFTDTQIELLETFARQAVIAIDNVRLFNEIRDKSHQLEVASRHKSEFLANMSHELRTPLNAIIGFTDVMLEQMFGTLNEKQKEYLEDVRGSGTHLLTLINDILDLSKIEAGRVELELGTFSFAEAIDNALTLVRERAGRHGITLAADVSPHVGTVTADERKVKQIVVNLLSNAVKFTRDGGWVGLTARCDGDQIEVAVRDTGIGIAPEDQDRVFEEFQQVGKDPERSREGTGLGLTLAKRFVELHGGRIWVESQVGKGSTFTFTIPVRQTAAGPAD